MSESLLLFLFALAILNSCSLGIQEEPTIIVDLENEISLELLPKLNYTDQYLWKLSTIKDEICSSSELITEIVSHSTGYSVYINGLKSPTECIEGQHEITGIETIEFVSSQIDMNFVIANIYNYASLEKDELGVNIEFGTTNGITLSKNRLETLQKYHIWAGIDNNSASDSEIFNELQNLIRSEMLVYNISDGNYGYFSLGNGIDVLDPVSLQKSKNGFALAIDNNDESFEKLSRIVSNFRLLHPDMNFYLYDGSGTSY